MTRMGSPFGGGNQQFILLILLMVGLSVLAGGGLAITRYVRDPILLIGLVIGFAVAVTCHEFMHAYVADRLGDSTGRLLGRMSLNPLVHLDVLGTLFLVLVGFGWGKPVPVNYSRLRGGRQGGMAVAFAGPATNFVIAAIFALPFRFGAATTLGVDYAKILAFVVFWNVLLGVFNLIPIPPLDGSKILLGLLPPQLAWNWSQFEMYGPFLLLLLLFAYPPFSGLLLSATGVVTVLLATPEVAALLGGRL